MTAPVDGGAAFPCSPGDVPFWNEGMSLRDYFAAHRDRLTYAEAVMIVAAERGPRPVVFVPATYSYPSVSKQRLRDQMAEMYAVTDARSAWDRRVKEVQSCPVAAEVDRMHRIAKEG